MPRKKAAQTFFTDTRSYTYGEVKNSASMPFFWAFLREFYMLLAKIIGAFRLVFILSLNLHKFIIFKYKLLNLLKFEPDFKTKGFL